MSEFKAAIERSLPAPPARVFEAWTDPTLLARWVWAGIGREPVATVDATVGGAYRVCTTVKDDDVWCFRGEYELLEPPRRLTCTLLWEADVGYPPGTERLDVTFTADDEGTRMTFEHTGIPDAESVKGHTDGWNAAFDKLAALVGKVSPSS